MKLLCFYVAQICQIKFIGHSIHSEVKDPFKVLLSTTKYLFYCLVKTRDFFLLHPPSQGNIEIVFLPQSYSQAMWRARVPCVD